jgi:lauroyl/myristoyl acyltransferase
VLLRVATSETLTAPAPGWRDLIRNTVGEVGYRLSVNALSFLPRRAAYAAGRAIGRLEYHLRHPGVQLHDVLVQSADPEQVESWRRRSCEMSVCEDIDFYAYSRARGRNADKIIEVRGVENLEAALARGKGALLFSGHIRGHYTLFAALAAQGFTLNIVGCHPNRRLTGATRRCYTRHMARLTSRNRLTFIWLYHDDFAVAVRATNALRRNEVVILEIDAPVPPEQPDAEMVEVEMLGGKMKLAAGHLQLARASGAPLLDFYVYRTEDWSAQIGEIGTPIDLLPDAESTVQACASRLEAHVRAHPAQWWARP